MISAVDIINAGFEYVSSYKDVEENVGYSTFSHKDEDLKQVSIDINYTDHTLSEIHDIEVFVPSFIINTLDKNKIDQVLSLMRPKDGEKIQII